MIIPNNFDRIQQLSTEKKPQSNYLGIILFKLLVAY